MGIWGFLIRVWGLCQKVSYTKNPIFVGCTSGADHTVLHASNNCEPWNDESLGKKKTFRPQTEPHMSHSLDSLKRRSMGLYKGALQGLLRRLLRVQTITHTATPWKGSSLLEMPVHVPNWLGRGRLMSKGYRRSAKIGSALTTRAASKFHAGLLAPNKHGNPI